MVSNDDKGSYLLDSIEYIPTVPLSLDSFARGDEMAELLADTRTSIEEGT